MGAMLQAECDGKAANLVARASGSAVTLVRLVASFFPGEPLPAFFAALAHIPPPCTHTGFRDQTVYKGRQIFFYKRAQILVGDLWAAYGRGGAAAAAAKAGDADTAERLAAYSFSDIHRLTMFGNTPTRSASNVVTVCADPQCHESLPVQRTTECRSCCESGASSSTARHLVPQSTPRNRFHTAVM